MIESVNQKVDVISSYNCLRGLVMPLKIKWHDRVYHVHKLGYYHRRRQGQIIQHIFHVTDGNLDFKLRFNTEDLNWILEEVSDGNIS